jgi:hypothetical protein
MDIEIPRHTPEVVEGNGYPIMEPDKEGEWVSYPYHKATIDRLENDLARLRDIVNE